MIIYLCGYMASGKSSIGEVLADKLSMKFLDTDKMVESAFDLGVHEIFTRFGEKVFRDAEHQLIQLIAGSTGSVVALGGGSICLKGNLDLVKKNGILIYLEARPECLHHRIINDSNQRPLLEDISEENLLPFIRDHLKEREKWYQQAHYSIMVGDKSVTSLVAEIIERLR